MKPRDYQHVKLRELKRSDNGRPYWAVEWRPERGDRRRRLFSDPVQAREEADHIEKLFSNGLRIVAELPLQKMIGIALMLQQIPNVPIHEIIQFYLQAHGINGTARPTRSPSKMPASSSSNRAAIPRIIQTGGGKTCGNTSAG